MTDEAIKLRNGAKLQYGQIIGGDMMQQRKLNSAFNKINPRDGAPKRTAEVAPVPGHYRRTSDSFFTGPGQSATVDDLKNLPIKSHAKPIAVHDGMTRKQRAALHPIANDPNEILADASRLGRPEKA